MQPREDTSGFERRCSVAAAVLVVASLCGAGGALAAETTSRIAARVQQERVRPAEPAPPRRIVIERRTRPQVALGGTVVLRGSRSETANLGQPNPARSGEGYGSSRAPGPALAPGAGEVSGLDASGIDRSGLSPENAP